jgi:hypothetical protein
VAVQEGVFLSAWGVPCTQALVERGRELLPFGTVGKISAG